MARNKNYSFFDFNEDTKDWNDFLAEMQRATRAAYALQHEDKLNYLAFEEEAYKNNVTNEHKLIQKNAETIHQLKLSLQDDLQTRELKNQRALQEQEIYKLKLKEKLQDQLWEAQQENINKQWELQDSEVKFQKYKLACQEQANDNINNWIKLEEKAINKMAKLNVSPDSMLGKAISNQVGVEATSKRAAENVSNLKNSKNLLDVYSSIRDITDYKKEDGTKSSYFKDSFYFKDQKEAAAKNTAKAKENLSNKQDELTKAQESGASEDKINALKTAIKEAETEVNEAEKNEKSIENEQNSATYQALANTTAALANIAKQLDGLVDEIVGKKSVIDTILNGSNAEKFFGSYWNQIVLDFSALIASPLVKQEDLYKNVETVVKSGISRDVEQMAMLETIKDKIAYTFDTFDSSVLRLIRIQDQNTTAARLGMEAALNETLNSMYETTEYLKSVASSVRSSLEEAEALMVGTDATEFEYQVQKWLGSMYSVGVSNSGVTSIASNLGKIAAGDVTGITSGGTGNLLIMAANNANLSIADILADGLDASETNTLLAEVVKYMGDLVDEANGNKVVQQQLANVFGLTASDLKAATNILSDTTYSGGTIESISELDGTYAGMIGKLYEMAGTMYYKMSLGEMLTNVKSNIKYSTAAGIASNPIIYMTSKIADIMDALAGGIPIPAVTAMGTGVDTKLTVSNIMKSSALLGGFSTSLIAGLASMISKGGNGFTGSGLLNMVGLQNSGTTMTRGASSSTSGTMMNTNYEDMTTSATKQGEDQANSKTAQVKEESSEVTSSEINENIVSIYTLLKDVTEGVLNLNVKVTNPISIEGQASNTFGLIS